MKPKLILASQSPRRRELLTLAGLEFDCIPSHAEERIPEGIAAKDVPAFLAECKARDILRSHPGNVVLGSDTIVVCDDEILGKPSDEEEAYQMLSELSGRTHKVYTGVAILSGETRKIFTTETSVEFYPLTEKEIRDYIKTGEPMDKAGAYGIQGRGALLVKKIDGDYYTVMGLPIAEVVRNLPAGCLL